MVKVGKRGGKVAAGISRYSAFLARGRVVRLLPAFDPQCLGPGIVPVGPLDIPHGEVYRCPPDHGTRFPDQIACASQQPDGSLGVPQRLGVAAENIVGADPSDQDTASRDAAAACQQGVQDRKAAPRLTGQNQGHGQTGGNVGLPVQVTGFMREATRGLELLYSLADIAEILEDNPRRLVCDRSLRRRRVPSQHLAGGGEGLRWPRQRQGQQLVRIPSRRNGIRCDRHLTNRI